MESNVIVAPSQDYLIDLDTCPTPVLLTSYDGRIVRSNHRLDKLFGYAPGDLTGQVIEVLVPMDMRRHHPEMRSAFAELPTTRRMGTGRDLYGAHKDGRLLPVEIGLDPVTLSGTDLIMVSVIDISERKANELQISSALNAASSAMIQVDATGRIELVNDRTQDLFGYQKDELIGQLIEILVPERFQRKHPVYRTSYENNRNTRRMAGGRDLYGRHKDGREIPIEISLTPVQGNARPSTMATINDVTERKARERLVRDKNTQLKSLNQELLQFAYSASHDLKAPLASIVGLTSLCLDDLAEGRCSEVHANLKKIDSLATRLKNRIEEMLKLARSDIGMESPAEIDIAALVQQTWEAVGAEDIHFAAHYAHQRPLRSAELKLALILENLLSNAAKYRDPHASDSRVWFDSWEDKDRFCFSVSDNGVGIEPQYQDRVFNLFQRVNHGDQAGDGVGLALVRKNVIQLGGEISLNSADGRTCFTVALPMTDSNNQPD